MGKFHYEDFFGTLPFPYHNQIRKTIKLGAQKIELPQLHLGKKHQGFIKLQQMIQIAP